MNVLYRFVLRRTFKGALLWGVIFAVSIAATAIGYNDLYPDLQRRTVLAATFSANTGVAALIGVPFHLELISGFTAWRTLGLLAPIGAIWGLLTAARMFRGEEETGRSEFFLAGQTTMRRAALQTVAALVTSLVLFTAVVTAGIWLGGRSKEIDFGLIDSLIFGATLASLAAVFMAIGFWMSQLAATRRQAAAMSGVAFALFFALRAIGSAVPDARWLLDITPFGWAGHVHPLTENNWPWIVLLLGFAAILTAMGLIVAGRRDMGASLIADRDSAPARTRLLHSAWSAALRLNRSTIIGWMLALAFGGLVFGNFAKPASSLLNGSDALQRFTGELSGVQQAQAAATFMSMGFLICSILLMVMVVALLHTLREDESEGYIDNFLVQPIRRWTLFAGRGTLIALSVLSAALAAGVTCTFASWLQQTGVGTAEIMRAALLAAAPALLLLGVGMALLGWLPRMMTGLLYGYIGWSFLMEMIGTLLNFNRFLLDTSILHHMALLPAAEPRWLTSGLVVTIGGVLGVIGVIRFNQRDIETD
ncbi:MAG TPA: hypothetical protein VF733_05315 [Candidatus Saccharimonadales bacterium]